jgi:hypothetical protein
MKLFTIGIDPGKHGGIVSLTNGKLTTIDAMPSSIKEKYELFTMLGFPNLIRKELTDVYIEQVHSMPSDGSVAAFSFGHHLGILDTILDLLGIDVHRVGPARWMDYFHLKRDKEAKESKHFYKKRILELARSKCVLSKKQQLTLATCDAYLIALYGYHQQLNIRKTKHDTITEMA